jgi:serine/threonine protein phosphatase PrpC
MANPVAMHMVMLVESAFEPKRRRPVRAEIVVRIGAEKHRICRKLAAMTRSARITAFSHRGRARARNEDTVAVGDFVSEPDMAEPRAFQHLLTAPLLCAVADGMGGHRAGEVASRRVAQGLVAEAGRLRDARAAVQALGRIDEGLYRAMDEDANLRGMGTTVVGLVLSPRLVWFNVGDSRLYRFSGGLISQVSIDDTPGGPRSGLLTQSLGGRHGPPGVLEAIAPHAGEDDLIAPARFLLCSDGLTDMLDDAGIAECLALPDASALAQLFDRAMGAGGRDNISIVLVSVEGG